MSFDFKLDGWEPMRAAYSNQQFNRYTDGPGQHLSEELQPGALARSRTSANDVRVYLRNVPEKMNEQGILNLIENYGHKAIFHKKFPNAAIVTFSSLK